VVKKPVTPARTTRRPSGGRNSTPNVGSERREEVLRAAAACFAEAGYRATSMRTIGDAAGMLAGSLYAHFESKLQMLQELMSRFFNELLPRQRAAYEAVGSVADRLQLMIDEVVAVCDRHREVVMVIEVDWHEISNTPELGDIVELGQESSRLLRRLLDEGVASGEVRADVDLDSVVRLFHSAIYGLLDRRFRLTGSDGETVADFPADVVANTINALFVDGIVRPAPRRPTR
jgi:TetR/AcrR family transcriptional regulator, cholesterol catabolism regulator